MDFKDKKEVQISDFEYDGMMSDLASLEKMYPEFASPDSPTVKVGSDIAGKAPGTREFRQYRHRYPMLSLGNTYNIEELQDFDRVKAPAAASTTAASSSSTERPSASPTLKGGWYGHLPVVTELSETM